MFPLFLFLNLIERSFSGLDGTRGVLISDDSLDEHIVEVDVLGPLPGACSSAGSDSGRLVPFALDAATAGEGRKPFRVISTRVNPAAAGEVLKCCHFLFSCLTSNHFSLCFPLLCRCCNWECNVRCICE